MPINKRQHYVPQNYLREFSPNGSSIGVFLIKTEEAINAASINSQAQEMYFYGEDLTLEKQLSELENILADNRRSIFSCEPKRLTLYQREALYQDMMLQLCRTRKMADVLEQSATAKARRIWKHSKDELVKKHADDFGIKYSIPALIPIMTLLKNIEICLDLEYKILINKTEIPFFTSDAPVSKYNKYFEAKHTPYCGLKHPGLILFYPLSPQFAVLYFDSNVNRAKYRKRDFIEVDDESDINNLNGLTCAWADKRVYYNPSLVPAEHVQWTYNHIREARMPLYQETEIKQTENSSLIISIYPFPFLYMALSFMKFQDNVKLKEQRD